MLRVLQERRVKPIGTTTEVKVDVRLIAATNEDLKAAIKSGVFREDLYHRINEFTIYMPHLCERGEDIPLFANFFLDQANRELEKACSRIFAGSDGTDFSIYLAGKFKRNA